MGDTSVTAVTEKDEVIYFENLNPHWTNKSFQNPQTIFLEPGFKPEKRFEFSPDVIMEQEVSYSYSDRLLEFHGSKCKEAEAKAKNTTKENTPRFFEVYLQILMDKQNLRLVHIISGLNGGGHPYRTYGYLEE